jgi:hypothetical protein
VPMRIGDLPAPHPPPPGAPPRSRSAFNKCCLMTATAWPAVATFITEDVLIADERIDRVTAALGGAVPMLLLDGTAAAHTVFSINRKLIFLLMGIMLILAVPQPSSRASPMGGESGRLGQHV